MIRGSLVTLEGHCGKPSCSCAHNRVRYHRRHYLSWTEAGRTRMLYVPRAGLKSFQRGIKAWVEFKQIAQQLARLNAQILKSKKVKTP